MPGIPKPPDDHIQVEGPSDTLEHYITDRLSLCMRVLLIEIARVF